VLVPAAAICRFCSRLHLEAHRTERVRNINSEWALPENTAAPDILTLNPRKKRRAHQNLLPSRECRQKLEYVEMMEPHKIN
jgi:hypothetical protein